tara:strand:- start:151 stop:501 length:351 start_codon:yes stop_codon:yes gene_type:complete
MREIKFRQFCTNEDSVDYGMHYRNVFQGSLIRDGGWDIMQYTGLKDKNGKEIYEGDIVEVCALHPLEPVFTTEVKWNTGSFTASKGRLYRTLAHWAQDGIEVIGNIHENPELLEQG